MISSAIWLKLQQNYTSPLDQVLFEKFYKYLFHQIAREIMLLLVNIIHEKTSHAERQDKRNFESVHALFVMICSYVTIFSCTLLSLLPES